jgi:hypothetical protein
MKNTPKHRAGDEPKGLSDTEQTRKDTSYSPSSGRDTEALQDEPVEASPAVDEGVDADQVRVLPGTGGPDDVGDTVASDPSAEVEDATAADPDETR